MSFKGFCFISDIGTLSLFYYMTSNFWELVLSLIIPGVVLLGSIPKLCKDINLSSLACHPHPSALTHQCVCAHGFGGGKALYMISHSPGMCRRRASKCQNSSGTDVSGT